MRPVLSGILFGLLLCASIFLIAQGAAMYEMRGCVCAKEKP